MGMFAGYTGYNARIVLGIDSLIKCIVFRSILFLAVGRLLAPVGWSSYWAICITIGTAEFSFMGIYCWHF